MRKIAVLFGGKSAENEISVLTGVFVLNLIDREKFQPLPVYLHTDGGMYTSSRMADLGLFRRGDFSSFKRVFFDGGSMYAFNPAKSKIKCLGKVDGALNCCHGGLGEGGGVSALMELNGIPLASPGLTPSGVFLDKALTKLAAKALNIPTVEYIRAGERDYARRGKFLLRSISSRLKYPVVVKPAHLGSSIGISLAETEEETAKALETVFALDDRAIVEKYVADKRDVNCAAYSLGGEICVSEPEEAASGGGIYSFSDKYLKKEAGDLAGKTAPRPSGSRGDFSRPVRDAIRAYTRTLYKRMNLKGIVRMDYLVSGEKVYLGEVNTVPGSLAYYLFCERISDAKDLFSDLLDDAIENAPAEKHIPSTGILHALPAGGKGCVRL